MIRSFKILLLIVASTLLFSCAQTHRPSVSPPKTFMMERTKKLANFTSVQSAGFINLVIRAKQKHSKVIIRGNSSVINKVSVNVVSGNLYIQAPKADYHEMPYPATVTVYTRRVKRIEYDGSGDVTAYGLTKDLKSLTLNTRGKVVLKGRPGITTLNLNGSANVTIHNLHTRHLTVYSQGTDHVTITGVVGLDHLEYGGHSWLSLRWADAPHLKVIGFDDGYAQIAGKVQVLVAEVHGDAQLNAEYLRASKTFVETTNHARADINAIDVQTTRAKGRSNIYYHNTPLSKNDYMRDYASVIDAQAIR